METVLATLLRVGESRDWVTFENAADGDEYVQLMLHDGSLYCEVSSREWQEPVRPLGEGAVSKLANPSFSLGWLVALSVARSPYPGPGH
jgi:hypothetical protein